MISSQFLLVASVFICATSVHGLELENAPFEAVGIKNTEGFGAPYAENDDLAVFAPSSQWGEKNETTQILQDRSLELVGRQNCGVGFGYCAGIGKCCPAPAKCCAWGYCINPGDTCCPNKPCSAGWNCCGTTHCSPVGAQCCYDGSYCSAGNICVIIVRTGQLVCCTDLSCTAHVVSGTTSYLRPTDPPSITQPPPPVTTPVDSYTTYYWTVTWWYYSYYWVTFQVVQSTVTYTQVYRTTTFTTTATDDSQASSFFLALSKTLHFDPPPDAQTGLASLLNVLPSETAPFSLDDDSTALPLPTESSSRARTTNLLPLPSLSLPTNLGSLLPTSPLPTTTRGGQSAASGVFIQWALVGAGTLSGVLMLWL